MVRNRVLVVDLEQSQKQLIYWRIYSQTERQSKAVEIGSIIAYVRNQMQVSQQSLTMFDQCK